MREFTLTLKRTGTAAPGQSLGDAASLGLGDELNELANLEVGQTYVDSDGDTWERTE